MKKLICQLLVIIWSTSAVGAELKQQKIQSIKKDGLFAPRKKQVDKKVPQEITEQEFAKTEKASEIKLTKDELEQLEAKNESDIELNFNNASLQNIVDQISHIFDITFIPDDIVKTSGSKIKPLSESKISFKTNAPFTRKKAWDFFTIFLELAEWSLVPTYDPQVYRIMPVAKAKKSSLPTYINTSCDILPKNDQRIRYVCFLENSTCEQMKGILGKLASSADVIKPFPLMRAIIITDVSHNVISLLQIIKELDKTTESQLLSVINLKEAEVSEVITLLKLLQDEDEPAVNQWMTPKKETTLYYFSKDVALIPAPRTNSLILVGPTEGVKRIENFVLTHIDTELKQMYRPVHVYELDYAPAKEIAGILNKVVKFGTETGKDGKDGKTVGEAGGVVGGLKYFGDVFIEAEEQGNRLLIRSSQEDYDHLRKIIDQLDKRQLQVAIEVMIVEIRLDRTRQLGVQWQTKNPTTLQGQMTGFFGQGAVVDSTTGGKPPYTNTLLANLMQLAKVPDAGTTLFTLGKESIYAILGVLDKNTQTRLIANPFIVATNKYSAAVAISEERRAESEIVQGMTKTSGNNSVEASLKVSITPQINAAKGMINLDIDVTIENFTLPVSGTDASNANKATRQVQTNANVGDKEVIALGGLIKKKKTSYKTKIPILSRIPIIGNIFKNEKHENEDSILVIFMSPTIIHPTQEITNIYTKNKANFISGVSRGISERYETSKNDPIYSWFFKPIDESFSDEIDSFVSKGIKKSKKKAAKKSKTPQAIMKSVSKSKEGVK